MNVSQQKLTKFRPTVCSVFDKGYRYGFNGMERDRDIANDDYDFGARIYDGRLGRWLSLDPLMKKYPECSPYSSFGNSPLIFIDPDGKVLKIVGDNGTYTYKDGKLYNENGDLANIEGDVYATSVLNQISTLVKTPTGVLIVNYLINENNDITLNKLDEYYSKNVCIKENDVIKIYFDPNNDVNLYTTNGLEATKPFIVLAHEMAHAISVLSGNYNKKIWFDESTFDEIYASYIENVIRKENEMNLRTYYALESDDTPNEKSKLLDSDGNKIHLFVSSTIPEEHISEELNSDKLKTNIKKTSSNSINVEDIKEIEVIPIKK